MTGTRLPPDNLTVAFLPVYQNPYQHLLTAELEKLGVHVEHLSGMPSARWLVHNRDRVQILHLHWLDGLYMHRLLTPLRLPTFLARLALSRRLGYRLVWTAHNILPHRASLAPVHRMVRQLVMARADAVIAHCEYGRDELLRRFARQGPIYVVPIGSYEGVYPAAVSRGEARATLGLSPEAFVYLFLGNIAAYKGLDELVVAFRQVAAGDDVLIIAGRNRDVALASRLEQAAAADTRLRVRAGFVPDDEMQFLLRGADVMVAPFRNVLTSSSVLVGMSYDLPIVAPAIGCLPELVSPEAGLLYNPADPAALGKALREIRGMDTGRMGQAARHIAASLRWEDIARQTAAIYRECLA
ncbi:MAG: glycosyltransferase family 4 protein [Anaerolineae bacterium]|nr:glycosyltransferase family 4 protein [Anaerolineae bacterium]